MRKIIVGFVLTIIVCFCVGCGDAYDNTACYYSVVKAYPDCKVYILPKSEYRFVAVKGNKIIYVTTLNLTNTDITSTYVLQKGE